MLRASASFPLRPLLVLLSGSALLGLAGCGMGTTAAPDPIPLQVSGQVHGGQQAVIGAAIQLYAVGATGNGSAATPLLTTPVLSTTNGSFSITGDYTCPSSTTQVYITATGGNPGLTSGATNHALAMMAALGSCGNLKPTQFITINEVTSVAAAWALAPFASAAASIGASSTNSTGIANAFLNAALIADTSVGKTATLPSGRSTETAKIYALADAMASCINSDGGSGCTPFFTAATPSGGAAPTDTFTALLNIVKHPASNVTGVFSAISAQPPFATSLTKAPSDWSLSLTLTGNGLSEPTALALDAQGNVWVADYTGALSAFNPQGSPLSGSPFGAGYLAEDYGLAIDPSGNVWVSVEEFPHHNPTRGSVARFLGVSSGGTLGAATTFSDLSIDYPFGLATDTNGNILIANNIGSSVVVLNPATSTYTAFTNNNEFAFATALTPDGSHGIWVADGEASATHVDSNGTLLNSVVNCCGPSSAIALEPNGTVWVASYLLDTPPPTLSDNGSLAELAPNGNVIQDFITSAGIYKPSGIAIDAAQNVWISNFHSPTSATQTISELAGSTSSTPGSPIIPAPGLGQDANMIEPYALAVDASGNIWVANYGSNTVTAFFGLAAPVKTPRPPTPVAP